MRQLAFPDEYDIFNSIDRIDGLDHIYILTIPHKYPKRYARAIKIAERSKTPITVWKGKPVSELTPADRELTHFETNLPGELQRVQAVNISHLQILRDARAKNFKTVLVLEDDAILSMDFSVRLKKHVKVMCGLPSNKRGIFYLGDALVGDCWHDTQNKYADGLYLRALKDSRCADSYLLNQQMIKLIVDRFDDPKQQMVVAIDHYLNKVGRENDILVCWAEPTYVTQGSMHKLDMERLQIPK